MTGRTALAAALASGLLVASLAVEAQQSTTIPRIGWLSNGSPTGSGGRYLAALRRGLGERGHVEGKNIVIDLRWADGKAERLPGLASELVGAGVVVIVALEPQSTRAAAGVTRTIPIIARFSDDPVGAHLVASLARPGGNITGVTSISEELSAKRLELLKEMLPATTRVAVLMNPRHPSSSEALAGMQAAARRLSVHIDRLEAETMNDVERAMRLAREHRAQALVPLRDALFVRNLQRLVALANQSRLPTIYDERAFVEAGGLMAFGANLDDLSRRAAGYVDKILKGAKPGDLPIEQPTTFELVINMRTAEALGLTIPPSILLRADHVIE